MDDKNYTKNSSLFEGWAFGKINYILFTIGVLSLILGYYLMASGSVNSFQSLTLSPILLFSSYVIIIPLALVYREKIDKKI
ncbi:DUF3098 domain-containing protein [Candidatus Marinimicrobia bacterium]|jgi:hypothetical protein|nr:DUF3098 domain-containing protein [Candidatus Neomarinimicrobiota bacterium]|tara:strand:- start:234 stop:476 length:243 start_codon:yes stop_codon:yes gene_type:complete